MNINKDSTKKLISVVLPVYCEEKNLFKLYNRLNKVTDDLSQYRWEYIFVNDGSTDNSYDELKKLAALDKKVKVLNLSKNFGKEIALSAGLEASRGDAVITMDSDLQHPPELFPEMIKKWEDGVKIVSTIRKDILAHQPLIRKFGSDVFYWIMKKISYVDMPTKATDFRLLDRTIVDVFKMIREKSRIYRGIIDWIGFDKEHIEFVADARSEGNSTYSYKKLIQLAINSITAFSLFPLKVAGYLGMAITFLSGCLLLIMFSTYFIFKSNFFSPLAIVAVANTFLIGIVLVCLGLIALYIGSIHSEVINRPLYIVRERINFD